MIKPSRVFITFIILGMFLLPVLSNSSEAGFHLFHATSSLTMSPTKSDLGIVKPSAEVGTNISLTYEYSRFARPKGIFSISPTIINVSIESLPSWCSASIEPKKFQVGVSPNAFLFGGKTNLSIRLNASINSNKAPGYESGYIVIKAIANENGNIKGSETTCKVKITPDFIPNVFIDSSNLYIRLKPGGSRSVYLNVTNNGNMDIVASLSPESISNKDVLVSPVNNIEIDANEKKEISINVTVKEKDTEINTIEQIPIALSYHAKSYNNLMGDDINIYLQVRIKSEEKNTLTLLNPILMLIIIAIFIVAVVLFLKYRR